MYRGTTHNLKKDGMHRPEGAGNFDNMDDRVVEIGGNLVLELKAKTTNYTTTSSDHTIICGAGNQTFTVTLLPAADVKNIIYNIKNIGTGTITIDGNSAETIDGATTQVISIQYDSISIQSDGTEWWII